MEDEGGAGGGGLRRVVWARLRPAAPAPVRPTTHMPFEGRSGAGLGLVLGARGEHTGKRQPALYPQLKHEKALTRALTDLVYAEPSSSRRQTTTSVNPQMKHEQKHEKTGKKACAHRPGVGRVLHLALSGLQRRVQHLEVLPVALALKPACQKGGHAA